MAVVLFRQGQDNIQAKIFGLTHHFNPQLFIMCGHGVYMRLGLQTFKVQMGSYVDHDHQFIILVFLDKGKEKKITRSSFVCRLSAMKKHKRSRRHNEKEILLLSA